ncbi:Peroxisomal membrane protein PAS20 [Clydaea vesicula]|uniref:Peroxisomal membrane protein PEX13 n=1 Tax=Clydaea vesicula TaxID=447962 RepID=A0AAD5XU78_9FUNG|nr:Peroxisomal membrane protein PAS20 [Clydaea vesicula]
MTSPPKPWESQRNLTSTDTQNTNVNSNSSAIDSTQPPQRPSSIPISSQSSFGNNQSLYGSNNYGSSLYGNNSYGSGMYGSSMYGNSGYGSGYSPGYGNYGGGYGYGSSGYGSYGGYNRMGGGYGMNRMGMNRMGGPMGDNNGELPLGARVEQSTQQAFFVIDQIVQSFMGFSQMLESTFMATHSSFMAMVGVAEQFGNLRNYLGQVLSMMSLIRMIKGVLYRISGRSPPLGEISSESFESFNKITDETKPKTSKKPLWIFLSLLIGFPWLFKKLLNRIQEKKLESASLDSNNIHYNNQQLLTQQIDPKKIKDIQFCRSKFDFNAESPQELSFKKGQIIAVLGKLKDPQTNTESLWWRGRLQNGQIGLFPANYVEIIEKTNKDNKSIPKASVTEAENSSNNESNLTNALEISKDLSEKNYGFGDSLKFDS